MDPMQHDAAGGVFERAGMRRYPVMVVSSPPPGQVRTCPLGPTERRRQGRAPVAGDSRAALRMNAPATAARSRSALQQPCTSSSRRFMPPRRVPSISTCIWHT